MAGLSIGSKRKAIADSNRTMFIWVAGVSAIVGICIVVSVFLVQQIQFRKKVVDAVNSTASRLESNNKSIKELQKGTLTLEVNEALNSAKANNDEYALQVILDSLPADRNPLALGSSLQQNLLDGIEGVTVESLAVDNDDSIDGTINPGIEGSIDFIPIQIKARADTADGIKALLVRLERSIRIIDVVGLSIEVNSSGYTVSITGVSYFSDPVEYKLDDKVIPR